MRWCGGGLGSVGVWSRRLDPQTFWVKFSGKTPLMEMSLCCSQWDSFTPTSHPSSYEGTTTENDYCDCVRPNTNTRTKTHIPQRHPTNRLSQMLTSWNMSQQSLCDDCVSPNTNTPEGIVQRQDASPLVQHPQTEKLFCPLCH